MDADVIFKTSAFGGFNKTDVMNYIKTLKEKEDLLNGEIKSLKEQNDALTTKLNYLDMLSADNKKQLDEIEARHKDELTRIQNEYEEKFQQLQNDKEAEHHVEQKIGSAMLDVRRYADLLLQETCGKINTMAQNADDAAAKTLSRMLDISSGIQAFSDKVNSILSDIIAENEQLSNELTAFKGSVAVPFQTALGNLEIDVLEE